MIGYNSCLAASLVCRLLLAPDKPDFEQGIQSGISAMRRLHQEGYGERARKIPTWPWHFPWPSRADSSKISAPVLGPRSRIPSNTYS